ANVFLRMRIGPARDVTGGIDAGHAGLEIRIYRDAAVGREPGFFGQRKPWLDAHADDHDIGLDRAAALQRRALVFDLGDGVAEMEDDAVLLVKAADEISHLGAEDAFHWPLLQSD